MIPKFQNPHLLLQDYNIVERSEIFHIEDVAESHLSGQSELEALASLETHLRSQFFLDKSFEPPHKRAKKQADNVQEFSRENCM